MNNVRYRLGNNLATRLEELEKILNEPLPYNDYCYPISDGDAFFRRSVQYENAIAGDSDVKLAECLWENLANSEVFEIEGLITQKTHFIQVFFKMKSMKIYLARVKRSASSTDISILRALSIWFTMSAKIQNYLMTKHFMITNCVLILLTRRIKSC